MKKMKGNNGYLVVVFLQIVMSWVCVTSSSRPFAPHDHAAAASRRVHQPPGAGAGSNQSDQTLEINSSIKEVNNMTSSSSSSSSSSMNVRTKNEAAATSSMKEEVEGLSLARIGSSPPNCEHKCYGCIPCEPAQVPTTHAHAHAYAYALQYANYEPEGWKCKCGPSFYTP